MNILVLGGTRFFGIPMIEQLLKDGHDVTVATRGKAENPFRDSTKQMILDRSDYDCMHKALEGKEYDVIIDKIAYCSIDVKNLLENVRCARYIQMSSCSVYKEDHKDIQEREFDPASHELVWMRRNENYSEGKRQAERAALEYIKPSQCIFVRYPVVLGPHDYTGRLKFYADHVLNEKPMYVDHPDYGMSFIHEEEAGRFIAHLVNTDISGAVNGSSHGMVSSQQMIHFIEKAGGKKAILSNDGDAAPYNGSQADVSYDLTKAEASGFRFTDLEDWLPAQLRSYIPQ